MAEPIQNSIYNRLLEWSRDFSHNDSSEPVDGENYELPGQTVYINTRQKLETGGRVEVNLTTPIAQSSFSWFAEITIDDVESQTYRHILLQTDGQIVETFGKTVTPIDDHEAGEILGLLQRLVD
jgi:hypothetical protein